MRAGSTQNPWIYFFAPGFAATAPSDSPVHLLHTTNDADPGLVINLTPVTMPRVINAQRAINATGEPAATHPIHTVRAHALNEVQPVHCYSLPVKVHAQDVTNLDDIPVLAQA